MILRYVIALASLALAQAQQPQQVYPQPDCSIVLNLTGNGSAPALQTAGGPADNRFQGCAVWYVSWSLGTGVADATLTLQSAPDANGAPGAWVTFANQNVVAGTNPMLLTGSGAATLAILTGYNPWVRILISSFGGTGSVVGAAYGWRQ